MKLLHLVQGDEFSVAGQADVYKLVGTADDQVMQMGTLNIENQRTKERAAVPETLEVSLISVV